MKLLSICFVSSEDLEFAKLMNEQQTAAHAHHFIYRNTHTIKMQLDVEIIPKIGDHLQTLNFQTVRVSSSHHKSQEKFTFPFVMILQKNCAEICSVTQPAHCRIATFFGLFQPAQKLYRIIHYLKSTETSFLQPYYSYWELTIIAMDTQSDAYGPTVQMFAPKMNQVT